MKNAIFLSAYEHFFLCDVTYFWVNFLLFAYLFLFQGTRYIPRPLQTKSWNISNKFFSVYFVVSSPHFITDEKSIVHIAHLKSHHPIFYRFAPIFKNSGCFGQFYYISNALSLHCLNDNPFCRLCMQCILCISRYIKKTCLNRNWTELWKERNAISSLIFCIP